MSDRSLLLLLYISFVLIFSVSSLNFLLIFLRNSSLEMDSLNDRYMVSMSLGVRFLPRYLERVMAVVVVRSLASSRLDIWIM